MTHTQEKAIEEAFRALLDIAKPPPRVNVWQWAEAHRNLPKSVTSRPGRYRVNVTPFQREPQECLTDPRISIVVLKMAKRLGKTENMLNLIGYTAHYNPSNILLMKPTLQDSEKFSKQSVTPMISASPMLKRIFHPPRERDSGNTIFSKSFPGGQLGMIGSNTTSALRGIQARVIICDEIDDYKGTSQGDAITQAIGRAENYPDAVILLGSTPTYKGASAIDSWYEKSDQRKWFVKCPLCNGEQVLEWSQVGWENGKPETAWLTCAVCAAKLDDSQRLEMILAGRWKATAPLSNIAGFWLNGLNSPFPIGKGYRTKLHQFAKEYLLAKEQGSETLKVWTNLFLCESWEDDLTKVDADGLMARAEVYGPEVPAPVFVLIAAADVQQDRIECEVVGYGAEEETWAICYRVFLGPTQRNEVWAEFDAFLNSEFTHASGIKMKIKVAAVDSGYNTAKVYEFQRQRYTRGVRAIKGAKSVSAPIYRESLVHSNRVKLVLAGTVACKDMFFSRLQITDPGPRFVHLKVGDGYDREWFKQLTSEKVKTDIKYGFAIRTYVKDAAARNEALDVRVYVSAMYELFRGHMKAWRKEHETAVAAAKPVGDVSGRDYVLDATKRLPDPAAPAPSLPPSPPQKPLFAFAPRRGGGGFVRG